MTTTLDDMTVGDAKKLAALFGKGGEVSPVEDHGKQIVIVDRGFVFVGDTTTDGQWCRITNTKNIRYWGTKAGLGELAGKGPLAETKLDPCGDLKIPMRAVIGLMEVSKEACKKF